MHRGPVSRETLERFPSLVSALPKSYRRVISQLFALQVGLFGVTPKQVTTAAEEASAETYSLPSRRQVKRAEILTDGRNTIVLQLRELEGRYRVRHGPDGQPIPAKAPEGLWLYVFSITRDPFDTRVDRLIASLRRVFATELDSYTIPSERFDELKAEGMEATESPVPAELEAARLLSDRAKRTLAIAIRQSGGLLVADVGKQLTEASRPHADALLAALVTAGLVARDIVVVCTKTQAQIARAPSRQALEQLAADGLRCTCGRVITDERAEEAVQVAELGHTLLDGSRWFSLLLHQELLQLGISDDRILTEQTSRGEEFDCLVDIGGRLVFFELKDKEFSLRNAYSFGGKIGIVRPDYPVIVTTDRVAADAKEHFQRSQAGRRTRSRYLEEEETRPVRYIEGLETLAGQLGKLATEIFGQSATRLLSDTFPHGLIGASSLLDALGEPAHPDKGSLPTPAKTATKTHKPRSAPTPKATSKSRPSPGARKRAQPQ